jgi:hypothetical protein
MTVTNVTPPTISGTARQGQTLTTSDGTWTYDLDYLSYAYQWLRCDAAGANCSDISGAVNPSYVVSAADVGSRLRSEVTATENNNPVGGGEIYTADFETGDFSQINSQQESSATRISLVTGIPWGEDFTAKVLIGPPDQGVAGSGNSYRTEMSVANQIAQKFGFATLQGEDTWITQDMLIDPAFQFGSPATTWIIITQFWTTGLQTGSPCFAIEIGSGQGLSIVIRGGTEANSNMRRYTIASPVPQNQHLKFKIHHFWSTTSSGVVEVWLNGTKVVTDTGLPNLASSAPARPEHKAGVYRSGSSPPTQDSYVLIDNINYWTSDPGPTY